jgi:glutamate-ammonia-ligase adenylyltransferase
MAAGVAPEALEWLDGLERGSPSAERLGRFGEPDPVAASEAFRAAAAHPDLAPSRSLWAAALLRTARPGFGAQQLLALAGAWREATGRALDVAGRPALPLLLGSSNFLSRLLLRHPAWCDDLVGEPPPPGAEPPAPEWPAIRRAKYRGLLRVAARDLLGRSVAASLRELSDLADGCLDAGLRAAAADTGIEPPSLLALGKLGGRELNFSSDVDLLFLYDTPPGPEDVERNHAVTRFVRALKAGLERPAEDGFAFRVDLDLRPEGPTGPIANSVDAALGYYESFGAAWERQALIRLRHVAGPAAAAEAFHAGILPFVYPRSVDPRALGAVRAMKGRIELERRAAGRDLERDLKEGPGGIRDVEFLVQALQLLLGGREPTVRTGNVLDALAALGAHDVLPEATVSGLSEAYAWLRRAEHAVQLAEERQDHSVPRDAAGQRALARRMGYAEPDAEAARTRLLDDWTAVRSEVRAHFEALLPEESVE